MNNILLINRINPKDYTGNKVKVFFLIGEINNASIKQNLMDLLDDSRVVDKSEIVYKYNGVELGILVQSIPIILKLLADSNISVYGVYAIYNP
ncbi:MAG: hypothetical protein RBR71_02710 [Gudongella sp.]|nr:hypothetical protein [Gudongella sp.]